MGSLVKKQAERFLREKQRQKRWLAIFLCLALVVTSGTFAALRMNGRAMDIEGKVLDCRAQAHQHTEGCYDEQGDLICGQADYLVHTHSAACYDGEGNLVCQIPEREAHVHDDSCYTEEKTLICGQEEAEGHQHSQDCYTQQIGEWICTQEAHEHDPLCYDGEGDLICGLEPHQHGDACYEWNEALTCGQEETPGHTHSEECYETEKTLTCGELELHEHDGPCYENGVLTCTVPELKEHVHNEECFRDADNETDDQLQGDELESEGKDPEQENGGTVSADFADSDSGDTVSADTVSGDSVSADTVSGDSISGNSGEAEETDEPREFSYTDDQVQIDVRAARAGIVPEDAELSVKPIVQQDVEALKADENVSENAVTEAKELNAKYEEVQKELEAAAAKDEKKELAGFLAYDISFLVDRENEETGETEKVEIEPDGSVEVSMRFADAYIPEMPKKAASEEEEVGTVSENGEKQAEDYIVDVVHLKETPNTATGEMKLDVETLDADIRTTDDAKVSEVRFDAESFSTFTITWHATMYGFDINRSIEVTYWDVKEDKSLDPDSGQGGDIQIEGIGEDHSFNIAEIKQDGSLKQYHSVMSAGKKYEFQGAYYIANENDKKFEIKVSKIFMDSSTQICYKPLDAPNGVQIQSGKIYFVYAPAGEVVEGLGLPTVDTLSNNDHKIKMYMHDIDYATSGISDVLGGTWKGGDETSGLVADDLGDDGFPVTSGRGNQNGRSLKEWFSSSDPEADRVDHLFLKDRYETDKTFYYSSYANYAYLEPDKKEFTVYDAIGTIFDTGEKPPRGGHGGNFFPYNNIVKSKTSYLTNKFDEKGIYDELSTKHPYGKELYRTQGDTNFHFGMYLETNFVQEKGGRSDFNGDGIAEPMRYEFTGDDDLWVFINGRLVLDIGGVHNAVKGTIDFSTGEVTVGELRNGSPSTPTVTHLKNLLDPDDIQGETLKDYETYQLKIFYLERNGGLATGGGALRMAFNLPTIGEGEVQVKKQLSNSNDKYANIPFNFKLMAAPESSDSTENVPKYDNNAGKDQYVPITANAVNDRGEAISFNEDGTFQLKPGETATFSGINKQRKFYVVETGFVKDLYDSVSVNGTNCTVVSLNGLSETGDILAQTETEAQRVDEGKRVIFTNNCSDKNSNEIHITKGLSGAPEGTGPFDIKVELEATDGMVRPYTDDYYLIKTDEDGAKTYYKFNDKGGLVQADPDTPGNMVPCGKAENGIVKIASGYTVVIPKLPVGTDFKISEDTSNLDEETYSKDYMLNIASDKCDNGKVEGSIASGSIKRENDAEITVTNYLNSDQGYTWQIVKKGTTKETAPLGGAVFKLTSTDNKSSYIGTSAAQTGVINWAPDDGKAGSPGIGSYILEETSAPANHIRSDKFWRIQINKNNITVTEVSDRNQTSGTTVSPTSSTTGTDGKTTYEYTFLNTCLYELPSTGGDGIYRYLVSGIFLMMASTLILYKNRRKEVVRK